MGNSQKDKGPVIQMPTPAEIKTYIMIVQTKLNLFRNKKVEQIRKKKAEIAKSLKENNLDVAKAKMDSVIREEDYITVYDILGPLLEILKERVTYIITSSECPPDLRAQLDSVIYASTRLEFEELYKLRDLIMRKYGSAYIQKAENNVDRLVNINLVEKLKIKPASDAFLIIRLKQLCKEKKIPFEFPSEITSDIPGDIGNNPFGAPGNNPYGGDFNPYASTQGPNPYGPPTGDNNPYGPPPGGNNPNPYGPPPGDNNPYGPPPGGNNPYGPPPGGNNPYGPPPGDNNPYGPPPGGNNPNPYGPPPGGDNNGNPFASQSGNNNPNPYGPPPGGDNNPFGPGGNQSNIFGGETLIKTENPNENLNNNNNSSAMNPNPYSSNINDNSNPYGNSNNTSNNPFAQNGDNPFAGNTDSKIGDGGFPKNNNEGGNPYQ